MKGRDSQARAEEAEGALHAFERAIADDGRLLVGIRHHSPACAAALPHLLAEFAPDCIALELPPDFDEWLSWLAHEDTKAPVALAAADERSGDLAFYPFASFSPELVTLRWAREAGVPVHAIDAPLGRAIRRSAKLMIGPSVPRLEDLAGARAGAKDAEALWDQLVEARASAETLSHVRLGALRYGWMVRWDAHEAGGIDPLDSEREAHMRERLDALAGRRLRADRRRRGGVSRPGAALAGAARVGA